MKIKYTELVLHFESGGKLICTIDAKTLATIVEDYLYNKEGAEWLIKEEINTATTIKFLLSDIDWKNGDEE